MLKDLLKKAWWLLLLRGVVAILFGIVALSRPGATMAGLLVFIGAWFLVDGVFSLVAALTGAGASENRWLLGLRGVLGGLVGLLTFVSPLATGLALLMFVAAWAIVTGGFDIVTAIRLRKEIEGEWVLVVLGVISILFGLYVVMSPLAAGLAITLVLGAYALVAGVFLIVLAFRVRGLAKA
jgi:uncharacterized membrane protein HdeD (DUF308 family)